MTLIKGVIAALVLSFSLAADPVNVSYTITGNSGDWTLDFSVNNNLAGAPDQNLYFFGVALSSRNITGSPGTFDPNLWTSWNNSAYGGSNINYDNNWLDSSNSALLPGSTTSGFEVTIADPVAPASVNWFAYTYGDDPYEGGGNFNNAMNPGFEGVATAGNTSIPEPSTLAFLGVGLAGLVALRRRKTA
jgi:hypothetical protein